MTPRRMLDTDVAIEVLRRRDPTLRERLLAEGAVALSTITVHELRYGAERSADPARNHAAIDQLTAVADVLPFSEVDGGEAGRVRAELRRAGTPIGAYDVLIAGHARAAGLILVTRNVREFERVEGLRVERW